MTSIPVIMSLLLGRQDSKLIVAFLMLLIGVAVIFDEEMTSNTESTNVSEYNRLLALLMVHLVRGEKTA